MNLKYKILSLFVQTYQKRKEVPYMEMSLDNDQKRKESTYMEMSRDNDQKYAYISNKMQPQNRSLHFNHKNDSLLSGTSVLSSSPMAYNTTASLDKPTCTDYVDFDKCQHRFANFLDQKRFQSFGCKTQSFQRRWQQRFPTLIRSYNERRRIQSVVAI